jgi:O-antigen/teichoic acid export membrane protein
MSSLRNKIYLLLRKSEKFFKTDMLYLAKGGFWMTAGTAISWPISLVMSVAFANLLSKDSYGTYQYVLGIVSIFGIMNLSGINTSITRSVARGAEGSLFDALRTKIRFGMLGGLGSGILGAYYFFQGNTLLGSAFLICSVFIPFWDNFGIYVSYLYGKKRFDLMNMYEVLAQFVSSLSLIITLFLTHDVLVLIFVYFVVFTVVRGSLFSYMVKKYPPNSTKDPNVISYGKHLSLMVAVSNISSNLDKVLLFHFLGPISVAEYTFAQAVPMKVNGFLRIVSRLAFPKMATANKDALEKTLMRKILLLVIPSAAVAFLFIAAAPYIFAIFFPKYMEAVIWSQIVALTLLLQPFALITTFLSAQEQKKSLYIYNFGMPIIRAVTFFTLIPTLHLFGAILSLVAIKTADTIFQLVLFYRKRSSIMTPV